MEKEFVTYQQALRLKNLGFDEECFGWYKLPNKRLCGEYEYIITQDKFSHIKFEKAPTLSQAFRWFRDKYGLHGIPQEYTLDNFSYQIKSNKEGTITFKVYGGYPLNFTSYEEAELACLDKLIEIVEKNNLEL